MRSWSGVANLFTQEWLHKSFAGPLAEAAAEVAGRPVAVRFAIDAELFRAARGEQAAAESARQAPAPEPTRGSGTARTPGADTRRLTDKKPDLFDAPVADAPRPADSRGADSRGADSRGADLSGG